MSEPEFLPVPWAGAPTTETEGVVPEAAQGRGSADGGGDEDAEAVGAKPEYQCRFCLKKFEKSMALGGHMNIHRQERKQEEFEAAKRILSETHQRTLATGGLPATVFDCNPGMPLSPSLGPNCNYFVQSNDLTSSIQGESISNIMQNQHLLPPSPVPNCNYYPPSNPFRTNVPGNYATNIVQDQQQQNQHLLPPLPGPTCNYYLPSIPSSPNIPGDYDTANMLNQERLLPLPVPNNFDMYRLSNASGSDIPANYVITNMQNEQAQWPRGIDGGFSNNFDMYGLSNASGSDIPANYIITNMQNQQAQSWPRGIDGGFSNAASNSPRSAPQGGDSFYHLVDNSMTTSLQSMDVEAEEFADSVLRSSSPPDVDGNQQGSSATPSPPPETFD